jgi:glycosyltransferase involved in cell wall biosynthesis
MFTVKPSQLAGTMETEKGGRLTVIETGYPDYEGWNERTHYMGYREFMEKNFATEDSIIFDHTWLAYPYLSQLKNNKLRVVHTHHGEVDRQLYSNNPPPVQYPRFMGLSKTHAQHLSQIMACPVRHCYNGIYISDKFEPQKDDGYFLSLNRISLEKGIHNAIDIAVSTRNRIKVIGDDIHVADHRYVQRIIEQCRNSGGLAEYYGLVDDDTKLELLSKSKCVISCTDSRWIEGFGLYCCEAGAYGKPVLALINGGIPEIVENKKTGFLASSTEKLKDYVNSLGDIDPLACRKRIEDNFTIQHMTNRYLTIAAGVLAGDITYNW